VPVFLNASQVVVEQVSRISREKFPQVVADAVFGLVAEQIGGGGID
jgi:hypothetical protein